MEVMVMIYERIIQAAPPGTVIPKPAAKANFLVKGTGTRRGERALIYTIPNHKNPDKPYQKGITATEIERAYQQLITSGRFNRDWFNRYLPGCSKEGGCNFTTIGGLFILLGVAKYAGSGEYWKVI